MWLSGNKHKARMLFLEVTHRCDLKCIGCYTRAGPEKSDSLTLDERKSVVRQAREMGARSVSLSGGGEPLLYKDLFALIDYIRQLQMRVVIFTNGVSLDKEAAEFLVSRNVVVYFKLYSLDPAVFGRTVGRENAYEWVDYSYKYNGTMKCLEIPSGLKHLLDLRETERGRDLVKIEALITRMNLASLPEVAGFSKELGLELHLETLVFDGRAIENYDDIAVDGSQYRDLYHKLVDILGEEYLRDHREQSCLVERNPVVQTNGEIGFCSSRVARIGNVRDMPLKRLFAKARRMKRKEDRAVAKHKRTSRYFHTCSARQYYEVKHGIPCDY